MKNITACFDGKVFVPLDPIDLPVGEEVVLIVRRIERRDGVVLVPAKHGDGTVGSIRESGFVGGWAHRTDIGDSVEFARQLRERSNKRNTT